MSTTAALTVGVLAVLLLSVIAVLVLVLTGTLHRPARDISRHLTRPDDPPPVPVFNPYAPWDRPLGSDTYRDTYRPEETAR